MTLTTVETVAAAGALCWRIERGRLRVLVVHRTSRSDVSFPKGKLDPGESLPEAAVRETLEETGIAIVLGAPLGASEYILPGGRAKIVHYWAAEVDESALAAARFTPSEEISSVDWVSLRTARSMLTYERDRELVDILAARAENDTLRTFAILVLRHGKAVPGGSWTGPDSTRPLDHVGLGQARAAAKSIAAYRPTKLISSTAARCVSTIEPIATLLALDVKATAGISQDAHEDGVAEVRRLISKRVGKRETVVLCSHGPVIPDIISEIAIAVGSPPGDGPGRAAALAVGEFAAVHMSRNDPQRGIVAIETHRPVQR